MSRSNHKVKDVSKYQSLEDLLYIQSNYYRSMSGQEYLADAVDDMIALKSDALALAMSDDYIEAMTDLHEYELSLLQNDADCPDYSESDLIPFIVSPVIVPTCFLGSLRSTFSFLFLKFNLTLSSHLTKTVLKGGNQAAQREKVPIMTTPAFFMNVHTGSIDTIDGWDDFEDFNYWRDAGTLVEVRATTEKESEDHGKWIEV